MAPALLFLVSSHFRSEFKTAPASAVRCVAVRCVALRCRPESKEEEKSKQNESVPSFPPSSLLLPSFPPCLPSHLGYLPLTLA
ncbi:hypothetical protein LZ31DRAFT_552752 [Colletotrichum somersetense]|nr:hypothetical protein LZ31DRAFT_552752 [Colletotrichum somersetense]